MSGGEKVKMNWTKRKYYGSKKNNDGKRGRRKKKSVESVLFVPMTPGSELAKTLQKMEGQFSDLHNLPRIRIVERGGKKLNQTMCKTNPLVGPVCGRGGYFPCANPTEEGERKRGMCSKEGIVYNIECRRCEEDWKTAHYIGESSRSGFQRGEEHANAWKNNIGRMH